jgi:RHS repeat-associated protein
LSYDGDGNRIVRTQGGTTTRYLVNDLTPTGYPQVAEEVVSGSVVAQFTYGSWRVSENRGGGISYYGYDGGNSVRQLFSDTGAITDTYDYDAFGNTVAQSGSTVNEFLYRGEQFDSALGLYYLRSRYYNPRTARFLTADSYECQATASCDCSNCTTWTPPASTHHLYLYADGDAVNLVDPTGRNFSETGELWTLDDQAFPELVKIYKGIPETSFGGNVVAPFCRVLLFLVQAINAGQPLNGQLPGPIPGWALRGAGMVCKDLGY